MSPGGRCRGGVRKDLIYEGITTWLPKPTDAVRLLRSERTWFTKGLRRERRFVCFNPRPSERTWFTKGLRPGSPPFHGRCHGITSERTWFTKGLRLLRQDSTHSRTFSSERTWFTKGLRPGIVFCTWYMAWYRQKGPDLRRDYDCLWLNHFGG